MRALLLFVLVLGAGQSKRVRRIVGGNPADIAASEDPIVYLNYAGKSARVRGTFESSYYHFRGIRFAYSPTGASRFQRPRKYFLEGEVDATAYRSPCIQSLPGEDFVFGSEDCLYLNIFTPNLPAGTEGLPVVIWIHGGGFRYGSASQYGARHLMNQRVILVTIQYRLGTLGFLSGGDPMFPGNAGLFDMVLAIQWVRNHIGFFGGNPFRINVMGHGTGGSSVLLVALSEIAKGQVSGVIAMSGTAVSHWAIDDAPIETAKEIAGYHGCPTHSITTMVKCLQNIPADSIVKGDSHLELTRLKKRGFISGLSGLLSSSPVKEGLNDGRSLPAAVQSKPLDDMFFKKAPKIPLLTGVTRDETKRAIQGQYKEEVVGKLGTVSHFLDNTLIKNLQSITGLGKDANNSKACTQWKMLDPLNFRGYASVATRTLDEGLAKVSEITGDVLFNLPAFLTADLWSRNEAATYLYQFEHYGQARKGDYFLKGVPIIGNHSVKPLNGTVCHGDELSYLFEAQSLNGSKLDDSEVFTAEDEEVREVFTQLIADFARDGKVRVQNREVKSFSSAENNFIRIKPKPQVASNFRFCQMALWTGLTERLQDVACKFAKVPAQIADTFFDSINKEIAGAPPIPIPGVELLPKPNPQPETIPIPGVQLLPNPLRKPKPQPETIPIPPAFNIFG